MRRNLVRRLCQSMPECQPRSVGVVQCFELRRTHQQRHEVEWVDCKCPIDGVQRAPRVTRRTRHGRQFEPSIATRRIRLRRPDKNFTSKRIVAPTRSYIRFPLKFFCVHPLS